MSKLNRLLALLLALAMAFAITACGSDPEPVGDDEPAEDGQGFVNALTDDEASPIELPEHSEQVKEKKSQNAHTVGWLEVPGTNINDVVVHYDKDNDYYWHRNFKQEQISIANFPNYSNENSWAYYADFRNKFGDGKVDELSTNTVIYGHTYDTAVDKNAAEALENGDTTYGKRYAQLKNFYVSEDFARETPYIYFSTEDEDLVWEVFAVFFATVNLPYNRPDLSADEHANMLTECLKRSVYTYDVDVTPNDNILTLSTCTYYIPGNSNYLGYPNNYRYVVMAKLIDAKDATKTEASFTVNPDHAAP